MSKAFYRVETFEGRKSLGYLIRRLHNLLTPRAEALFADADFSFTQWVVLMAVRDGIATTCSEISRHVNHDTGATTRLVDQLEARGLLERRRSTEDRRVVNLALTPAGIALAKTLTPRIVDFWNVALDGFTVEEFTQMQSLMTRLMGRLESMPIAPVKAETAP
jgi:DNA-binding MarR family transcriptional regulator